MCAVSGCAVSRGVGGWLISRERETSVQSAQGHARAGVSLLLAGLCESERNRRA